MNAFQNSDLFQKLAQVSFQAVGYVFTASLVALLFSAWALTEPIFQLSEWLASGKKLDKRKF